MLQKFHAVYLFDRILKKKKNVKGKLNVNKLFFVIWSANCRSNHQPETLSDPYNFR